MKRVSISLCVEYQASVLCNVYIYKSEFHTISVSLSLPQGTGCNRTEVRVRFVVNGVPLGKVNLRVSLAK
jgi:hypothetical protein